MVLDTVPALYDAWIAFLEERGRENEEAREKGRWYERGEEE